jgi:hypothetical protein
MCFHRQRQAFRRGDSNALRQFRFYRASQVILSQKPSPTTELWQWLVGYAKLVKEIWPIIEYLPGF